MELRQLKYFLAVAKTCSFSEASRRLYVSQSTLSQQIIQLEYELGSPLFLRTSRSVVLTEAGIELLPLAQKVVDGVGECSTRINDLRKVVCGSLNVGGTYSFGALLSETIIGYMKAYPGVKLNVSYAPMDDMIEKIMRREVDFALGFKPSVPNDLLEIEELFDVPLSVIMRKNHPLAEKEILTISDLRNFSFVLPARGLQSRKALDRLMDVSTLRVRSEVNAPMLILDIVSSSEALSILSDAALRVHPGLVSRPLEGLDRIMRGSIIRLRDSYIKNSEKAFVEMVRDSAKFM